MASTVVVQQPMAATPVQLDVAMTERAWEDYQESIWTARLDAAMHAAYFYRVRRVLGALRFLLEFVVSLGSAGAVVSVLGDFSHVVTSVVTIVVAVCATFLQVANIADRTRTAMELVEAWNARARFWDDAWIKVRSGHYLGPLPSLCEPELALARAEESIGFPDLERWQVAAQKSVLATDPLARARAAT